MSERAKKEVTRYYIGNRQYVPDESVLLCEHSGNEFTNVTEKLYYTQKGTYFLVQKSKEVGTKVLLLENQKAAAFMDEHTAGILIENYDMVLVVYKVLIFGYKVLSLILASSVVNCH